MKNIGLFLILLLSSGGLIGQELWTLDRALHHAEENSLMILLSMNDIRRAEADLSVARQRRVPSLNFTSSFNMSLGRTIDPTTNEFTMERYSNQRGGLAWGVQLFKGGAIKNQVRDARMDEKQAHRDVAATQQEIGRAACR